MPERFVLAVGTSVDDVITRHDVEIVERRPTFVVAKASAAIAADLWRRAHGFVTVLHSEDAARAAVELFDHVPRRLAD